jgi:hypothetical protein
MTYPFVVPIGNDGAPARDARVEMAQTFPSDLGRDDLAREPPKRREHRA